MSAAGADTAGKIALAVLIVTIAVAVLAPIIATARPWIARDDAGNLLMFPREGEMTALLRAPVPHDPNAIDLTERLEPPSSDHLLGTDGLGRDVLARIIHGARVSLTIGVAAGVVALLIGTVLGIAAGSAGGWIDALVLRLIETALCFPFYFVALAIVTVLGPSLGTLLLALVLTSWTAEARLVRGEVLRLRDGGVVEAARSAGAGSLRILVRHVLPNAITPAIISSGFGVAAAILAESALSFLGFGVPLPLASWGSMLATADDHLFVAWWLALFPGLSIAMTTGAIQVLAERARRRVAVESSPVALR